VGPGASGKSFLYAKVKNKAPKFDRLDPQDAFFMKPSGAVSYCSVNYPLEKLIVLVQNTLVQILVCRCAPKTHKKRLTDRLFKRMKKYKNDDFYRQAMDIFVKNYTYDYDALLQKLHENNISYMMIKTG
jgi:hypothetical protein